MKKMISSALVVVLTFITVMVMVSFKTNYSFETVNITKDKPDSHNRPDGTGLIFEDYDKNINIPVNNKVPAEKKDSNEIKEEKGDKVNYNNYTRYKRLYEDYIAFNEPIPENEQFGAKAANYIDLKKNDSSKNNLEAMERKIELSDKVYIAKMATNLNLEEISAISKAINKGANERDVRMIWNILKDKLSEKDYERIVEIVNKYGN